MGFMIQLLFEPGIMGSSHIWCTRCGKVHSIADVSWETSDSPSDNRDAIGNDLEVSPHTPICTCGENNVIGTALHDYNLLRTHDDVIMYPRRKEIKVWNEVEPYRTKKGKLSTWKLDRREGPRQMRIHDSLQAKLSIRAKLTEILDMDTFVDLYQVFGDIEVTMTFMELATKDGLVVIYPRTSWHPRSPWDEKKKLGWRKDPKSGWVNLKDWDEALELEGFSMTRGALIRKYHTGETFWYDPMEGGDIMVRNAEDEPLYTVPYNEEQDEDTSDDAWIAEAYEGSNIKLVVSDLNTEVE